jgi:6-pyruvoyltetrahydropterin/6-carboxytetrahydropterin synthase
MIFSLETRWSSAHLYKQSQWTDTKNKEQFGKCFSVYGHGHDYLLIATWDLSDERDSNDSQPFFRQSLDHLREALDHHHINFMIEDFNDHIHQDGHKQNHIPTTENLALYCLEKLSSEAKIAKRPAPQRIRLYETPDLWVELINQ